MGTSRASACRAAGPDLIRKDPAGYRIESSSARTTPRARESRLKFARIRVDSSSARDTLRHARVCGDERGYTMPES